MLFCLRAVNVTVPMESEANDICETETPTVERLKKRVAKTLAMLRYIFMPNAQLCTIELYRTSLII